MRKLNLNYPTNNNGGFTFVSNYIQTNLHKSTNYEAKFT